MQLILFLIVYSINYYYYTIIDDDDDEVEDNEWDD